MTRNIEAGFAMYAFGWKEQFSIAQLDCPMLIQLKMFGRSLSKNFVEDKLILQSN